VIDTAHERLAPRQREAARAEFWKIVVAQYGAIELQSTWRRAGAYLATNSHT
jgi:hypothetical protein